MNRPTDIGYDEHAFVAASVAAMTLRFVRWAGLLLATAMVMSMVGTARNSQLLPMLWSHISVRMVTTAAYQGMVEHHDKSQVVNQFKHGDTRTSKNKHVALYGAAKTGYAPAEGGACPASPIIRELVRSGKGN